LVLGFVALLSGRGLAQDAPDDAPGWSLDLGAIARSHPLHVGAGRNTTDVMPIVEGRFGDRLTVSFDDGIRWAAVKSGPFSLGPVLEYRQIYNDGLPGATTRPLDGDVEIGGFASVETAYGEGEVRLRKALTGYQGWSGDAAWDVGGRLKGGWQWGGEVRASWVDAAFLDQQFGLSGLRGRAIPGFKANDSYWAGLELTLAHPIGDHLMGIFEVSDDHLLGAMPATPLFKSRDDVQAGIGVTWRFGRRR
jgi:outer membrane scaffolding protein for murein synthesis (MipA/OmpV family)